MVEDILKDYQKETECDFKNEHYSVRDNGSVLRHPKNQNKPRQNDNQWTFGKPGDKGYLYLSGVQVHRIVATAFLGPQPDPNMIVDHLDTNKQNNRPENLKWKTREENANNPYTLAKLKYSYPEAFQGDKIDWAKIHTIQTKQNTAWMRPVSSQEAQIFKNRMDEKLESTDSPKGKMGEWVFHNSFSKRLVSEYTEPELIDSLTPGAKQVYARWKTPVEFPCLPQDGEEKTLEQYLKKLKPGSIFAKSSYGNSIIDKASFTKDKNAIIVKTFSSDGNVKSGGHNSKITYKDGYFIHETLGSYFDPDGAEKYYKLAIGEEWTGGDVFDDFC